MQASALWRLQCRHVPLSGEEGEDGGDPDRLSLLSPVSVGPFSLRGDVRTARHTASNSTPSPPCLPNARAQRTKAKHAPIMVYNGVQWCKMNSAVPSEQGWGGSH